MSGGLNPGTPEWLMAMRVYYAKDPDVVWLLEEYDKLVGAIHRKVKEALDAEGCTEDDEWNAGG